MIVYVVIAAAVLGTMVAVYWFGRASEVLSYQEAEIKLQDFNFPALIRLLSGSERAFLEQRLEQRAFARIERRRMRVVLLYLSELRSILDALPGLETAELRSLMMKARLHALRCWLWPVSTRRNPQLETGFQRCVSLWAGN